MSLKSPPARLYATIIGRASSYQPVYGGTKGRVGNIANMSSTDSQAEDFDIIDSQEASLGREALEKIRKWLQPTEYMAESSEFRRHLLSQAPQTGLWICDTEKFKKWHASPSHGSLWIKGVPGAGKSVLAASLVHHLRSQEDLPVLFFFFRYILVANRRARSLMQDWLAQLLPHSLRLQASLQPMLECELNDLSDERLWELLLLGLSSIEKAYCVVDALDEMEIDENNGFLARMNSLATFRPDCIKLLMTSRPKQYLQSSLMEASIVHISLQDDLVGKDIANFVSYRLQLAVLDKKDAGFLDSLVSTICTRSQGLFLYARLLLDQITPILQQEKQVNIESLARSLPIGLEDMYNSMLLQQAEDLKIDTTIQVFLLECACYSSRNLRLNELANFLQFNFPPSLIPGIPKAITRVACAPLLEIMEDETVQVIHHSFTEFLLDRERTTRQGPAVRQFPVLDPSNVHRLLATRCLEYLQSGVLEPNPQAPRTGKACCGCHEKEKCYCEDKKHSDSEEIQLSTDDYQRARLQHPFLDYAVHNWSYHASKYDIEDESFFTSIKSFTAADSDFRRWLSRVKTRKYLQLAVQTPTLLHIAAFAGLSEFAKHILLEGHAVDSRDVEERTPLLWASSSGHSGIVSTLLEYGAVPDAEDEWGVKSIHLAAKQNSPVLVELLLKAGVDPISPKTKEFKFGRRLLGGQRMTKGNTAVQDICQHGHTETLLVMIPFLRQETLGEVLCETCRYGKFESARVVLDNTNVSVDSTFTGATALYLASIAPNVDCVRILVERGAEIRQKSEWNPLPRIYGASQRAQSPRTPLQGLVHIWDDNNHPACTQIFQILMRAGADLKEMDTLGETPLLSLFQSRGHPSMLAVKTLLDAGADASDIYQNGDTILHKYLAKHRDFEMLDLLLAHGADITACDNHGQTVLHAVIGSFSEQPPECTNKDVVEYLLDKGAKSEVIDASGRSTLEDIMIRGGGDIEIFRLLLMSSPEESKKQCLWLIGSVSGKEQIDFIRELQAAGISLDERNSKGETVLLTTMGFTDTWKALVECGASLHVVDFNGCGALHHSILSTCSNKKLQELIEAGLDPHMTNREGETLLHLASEHYKGRNEDVERIEYLLNLGLSVNSKTRRGCTPLHLHIESGEELPTSFLGNEAPGIPLLSVFQNCGNIFDINMQDNDGLSALHLSAMRSEFDVARLLDAGADPTLVTKDGRTVLHVACRARRSGVVGLLLDKVSSHFASRTLYDAFQLY
jgi:ankyrin repeat protein